MRMLEASEKSKYSPIWSKRTAPGQTAIADELTYSGAFVDRIGRRVGYHFGKTTVKIREVTGCSARLEVDGKGDLR